MSNGPTETQELARVINSRLRSIYTLLNGSAADLSALTTSDKSSLPAAINEINAALEAQKPAKQRAKESLEAEIAAEEARIAEKKAAAAALDEELAEFE